MICGRTIQLKDEVQSRMLKVLYWESKIFMFASEICSLPALTISTRKVRSNERSICVDDTGDGVAFRLLLLIALTRLAVALASNRCFTLLLFNDVTEDVGEHMTANFSFSEMCGATVFLTKGDNNGGDSGDGGD